jgi:UTP--glucose-1-phosphate uridylyltransferase
VKVDKAVITAAGADQRMLPLQTVIDRDGVEKPVLSVLIEEALSAGIEEVCVVVWPGDEARYEQAAGRHARRLRFMAQEEPRGYGGALYTARSFTGGEPFLHLVGDHLYVTSGTATCAQRLVECALREQCSVSAVQVTREGMLSHFGAVGGRRMPGRRDLYRIETVLEKPTPTEAEQRIMVPGIRAGSYLCFFGMHVFTPAVMGLLGEASQAAGDGPFALSPALAELARREQYLAVEEEDRRYDIGERYGLLMAQFALALNGRDRTDVLTRVVELLAAREITAAAGEDR